MPCTPGRAASHLLCWSDPCCPIRLANKTTLQRKRRKPLEKVSNIWLNSTSKRSSCGRNNALMLRGGSFRNSWCIWRRDPLFVKQYMLRGFEITRSRLVAWVKRHLLISTVIGIFLGCHNICYHRSHVIGISIENNAANSRVLIGRLCGTVSGSVCFLLVGLVHDAFGRRLCVLSITS